MWPDFKSEVVERLNLKERLTERLVVVGEALLRSTDNKVCLTREDSPLRDGGGIDATYHLMVLPRPWYLADREVPIFHIRFPKTGDILVTAPEPFQRDLVGTKLFCIETLDDITLFERRLTGSKTVHQLVRNLMEQAGK